MFLCFDDYLAMVKAFLDCGSTTDAS